MTNILTVSIVLYRNNYLQIENAINSVLSSKLVSSIYLIDNSPTNEFKSLVTDDRIVYIFNSNNVGFGAGHNKVIEFPEKLGKYHLVLNPDIYFENGVLEILVDYLEKNEDIGLVMPKILYPDGKIQYLPKLLPSPWSIIKRKLPLPYRLKSWILRDYELRFLMEDQIIEIPIVSGCFSLFRSTIFEKVGVYDARFFMYFEDFDISRRVNKYFKTIYFPEVFVYHGYERGAQKSWRLLKIYLNSFVKYFIKWGWVFDIERRTINKLTLRKIRYFK